MVNNPISAPHDHKLQRLVSYSGQGKRIRVPLAESHPSPTIWVLLFVWPDRIFHSHGERCGSARFSCVFTSRECLSVLGCVERNVGSASGVCPVRNTHGIGCLAPRSSAVGRRCVGTASGSFKRRETPHAAGDSVQRVGGWGLAGSTPRAVSLVGRSCSALRSHARSLSECRRPPSGPPPLWRV